MKSKTSRVGPSLIRAGGGAAITLAASLSVAGAAPGASVQAAPVAQEDGAPPPTDAPQGSSRLRQGEDRYDQVGRTADAAPGEGVFALSGALPAGSHAEITALDTGRTILVSIRGEGQGFIALSADAASQLGVTGNAPVRVRRVKPTPQDIALLGTGRPAQPRADAPPALLKGLRTRLVALTPAPAAPPPKSRAQAPAKTPAPQPASATKPTVRPARGLFVQVAALSNAARARTLAGQLNGVVRSGGGLYRVQIGPFADNAAAQRARADVARRGFGDARIISVP